MLAKESNIISKQFVFLSDYGWESEPIMAESAQRHPVNNQQSCWFTWYRNLPPNSYSCPKVSLSQVGWAEKRFHCSSYWVIFTVNLMSLLLCSQQNALEYSSTAWLISFHELTQVSRDPYPGSFWRKEALFVLKCPFAMIEKCRYTLRMSEQQARGQKQFLLKYARRKSTWNCHYRITSCLYEGRYGGPGQILVALQCSISDGRPVPLSLASEC